MLPITPCTAFFLMPVRALKKTRTTSTIASKHASRVSRANYTCSTAPQVLLLVMLASRVSHAAYYTAYS
jgi:hypothetical protein